MALYSGWFTGKVLHHVMSDHLLPNSRMLQCPWSGCSEWLSTVDGSQIRFLAHLSRRLIGELIVYPCSGVRPSSVRPSSTTSKIFFSETARPIVLILHIHHLQVGGKNNCVF